MFVSDHDFFVMPERNMEKETTESNTLTSFMKSSTSARTTPMSSVSSMGGGGKTQPSYKNSGMESRVKFLSLDALRGASHGELALRIIGIVVGCLPLILLFSLNTTWPQDDGLDKLVAVAPNKDGSAGIWAGALVLWLFGTLFFSMHYSAGYVFFGMMWNVVLLVLLLVSQFYNGKDGSTVDDKAKATQIMFAVAFVGLVLVFMAAVGRTNVSNGFANYFTTVALAPMVVVPLFVAIIYVIYVNYLRTITSIEDLATDTSIIVGKSA